MIRQEDIQQVQGPLEDELLRSQVGDLRALYRSARRIARAEDLDVLLNTLVEDVANTTDFEGIVVLYYDQDTKAL